MARSSRRSSRSRSATVQMPGLPVGDIVAAGFLLLAIVLGGSGTAGVLANFVLRLASILIIAWCVVKMEWLPERRSDRFPLLLAIAFMGYMLLQLVPLPPAMWTALPGRERVVEGFEAIGLNPLPWMPLSLAPSQTLGSAMAMLPPIAALMIVLHFGRGAVQAALWALFAAAVASALIGLGQLTGGPGSPLYFYAITNFGSAVGFFANSNHLATLMLVTLPLVAAVALRVRGRSDAASGATVALIAAPAVALVALLGLLAAGSLAGLLLAPIALGGAFLIFRSTLSGRAQLYLLAGGIVVVAAAVAVVALSPSMLDFGTTSLGTEGMSRPHMWGVTVQAIPAVLPLGGGFGSFDAVFRQFEDGAAVTQLYANHAHSDLLETLLEGGAVSALFVLVFLGWFVRRCWKLWFSYGSRDSLGAAASIVVLLVLLHSLVDYPLRTAAIAVPFAFCCGLMARSPRQTASIAAEATTGARHLSVV